MAMIETIHGMQDESALTKKTGVIDHPEHSTEWVEYWDDNGIVHRSVHVTMKVGTIAGAVAGAIG